MAKCEFMDCDRAGRFTDPKLVGSYCEHHRRTMMDVVKLEGHNAETEKLKEALDCATYAFDFIIMKGCLCEIRLTDGALAPVHKGLCHVLAAQNALAAIKEKLGDR